MCAVAPSRVRGATATEVEGAGYMGDAPGSFGCGPTMRARYAGGAGRVRVSQNDSRILGQGFSGEAAGSIARERYECRYDCEDNPEQAAVPDTWAGGGHLRGGYSNENWSIHAGASVWSQYEDVSQPGRQLRIIPDLELGAGFAREWRLVAGLGTPTLGALRHPGVYIGGDFAIGAGELQARLGGHRTGPTESIGWRAEVVGYVPVVKRLDLRLSLAGLEESGNGGADGSLGVRLGF